MIDTTYNEAATEVLAILRHTEKEKVDKIPKKFIKFLIKNSSKTYKPNFDYKKSISELNLKPKTQALLGIIYLKYWADEEGKKRFTQKIKQNEEKYQRELKEKYSTDNLFKNKKITKNQEIIQEKTKLLTVKNKTILQKMIDKIKEIFRRR